MSGADDAAPRRPPRDAPPEPSDLVLVDAEPKGRPRRALPAQGAEPVRSIAAPMSAAALAAPILEEADRADLASRLAGVVMRLTAVAWVAGTVVVWGRLVGYGGGALTPSWHDPGGPWLTTMTAAVVFPVVAVGLWLVGRWGLVVFAAAIGAGAVLLALRPDLVPFGPLALAGNLCVAALLAGLATIRELGRRRAST